MVTRTISRSAFASEKRKLVRRVRSFKKQYLFIGDDHVQRKLGVEGVFIDHKKARPRAIILYAKDTPMPRLRKVVREHFVDMVFKLVALKGRVKGSIALLDGSNILRDAGLGQGTIGGWLRRKSDGVLCGFSNNHVIALANTAPNGAPLFRGGVRIGNLSEIVTLCAPPTPNTADFAVFTIAPGHVHRWCNTIPNGTSPARAGLPVTKIGFATGTTNGVLCNVEGGIRVQLAGRDFLFDGIFAVHGNFADNGDSGALVRSAGNGAAVAIQFAHATGSDYSYVFPLQGNTQLAPVWNKYDWLN